MNYRIAYNFLNIELRSPLLGATEELLKHKGFTDLKVKNKKSGGSLEVNKLWLAYRYNFIVPVSESEPPLIRVDKWFQNVPPEFHAHPDMGLMSWFPIYVIPEDKVDVEKIDRLYNAPVDAGSINLVGAIWTLFKTEMEGDKKYKLLINNGLVNMAAVDKEVKKFRDILDLAYIDNILEENRNIEVA